ncbi:hypothetical protein IT414_03200 [bacterium]|nr:hypothetical protein [bacterium]
MNPQDNKPRLAPEPKPTNSNQTPTPSRHNKKKIALGVIIALLLMSGASAATYFLTRPKPVATTTPTPTATATPTPTGEITINGNKYFAKPKKVTYIPLLSTDKEAACSNEAPECSETYQIGTAKDGAEILVQVSSQGLGYTQFVFLGNAKKYQIISALATYLPENTPLAAGVSTISTNPLSELLFDESASVSGVNLTGNKIPNLIGFSSGLGLATLSDTAKKLGEINNKVFWSSIKTDSANYQVVENYATLGGVMMSTYKLSDGLITADDKKASINWTKGENVAAQFFSGGNGCGTVGYVITKNTQSGDLTEVGKSADGRSLYQLPNNNALVQELYNKDYANGEYLDNPDLKKLSIDQFVAKHGYVLVKNALDQYVVLQRRDMFFQGGCAKPVVYLYPTQTTSVSVAVGADVTVSEPLYPAGGWRNVIAQPNGRLNYMGKNYDSLFWEGKGNGAYPTITSGTIVRQDQLLGTIRRQLAEQGLNAKETADFMDFWTPNLPKDPYVRLTWFGNRELGELAPLYVSPRPNTSIRVFLDAEGLLAPISMPQQQLSPAPARTGLTLVEWGGLARYGLSNLKR